jgi:hypothetical protein
MIPYFAMWEQLGRAVSAPAKSVRGSVREAFARRGRLLSRGRTLRNRPPALGNPPGRFAGRGATGRGRQVALRVAAQPAGDARSLCGSRRNRPGTPGRFAAHGKLGSVPARTAWSSPRSGGRPVRNRARTSREPPQLGWGRGALWVGARNSSFANRRKTTWHPRPRRISDQSTWRPRPRRVGNQDDLASPASPHQRSIDLASPATSRRQSRRPGVPASSHRQIKTTWRPGVVASVIKSTRRPASLRRHSRRPGVPVCCVGNQDDLAFRPRRTGRLAVGKSGRAERQRWLVGRRGATCGPRGRSSCRLEGRSGAG